MNCPCGATDVPMAWGAGSSGTVRLYRHVTGVPYAGKSSRGDKCGGPADLFSYLLAAWGLALFQCDDGRVRRLTLEGVNEDKVRELIASERGDSSGGVLC